MIFGYLKPNNRSLDSEVALKNENLVKYVVWYDICVRYDMIPTQSQAMLWLREQREIVPVTITRKLYPGVILLGSTTCTPHASHSCTLISTNHRHLHQLFSFSFVRDTQLLGEGSLLFI